MKNSNSFDFRRAWLVLKRDIVGNRKKNLNTLLGFYAAITLIMTYLLLDIKDISETYSIYAFRRFSWVMADLVATIMTIAILVYASRIMKPMETKEKRIAFLMLPANRLEKYLARLVYVLAGSILTVIIATLLAELTRYVIMPVLGMHKVFYQSFITTLFTSDYNELFPFSLEQSIVYVTLGFFTLSTFVLCGTIWHKNAFFKTLGVMVAVPVVLATLITTAMRFLGVYSFDFYSIVTLFDEKSWAWVFSALFILLTVLFFLFSYLLFSRSQIVGRI